MVDTLGSNGLYSLTYPVTLRLRERSIPRFATSSPLGTEEIDTLRPSGRFDNHARCCVMLQHTWYKGNGWYV